MSNNNSKIVFIFTVGSLRSWRYCGQALPGGSCPEAVIDLDSWAVTYFGDPEYLAHTDPCERGTFAEVSGWPQLTLQQAAEGFIAYLRDYFGGEDFARVSNDWGEARLDLARDPSASPEVLAVLAMDDWADTRQMVACHPACPHEVLERLARDPNDDVRHFLAQRGSGRTPEAVYRLLVQDSHPKVRALAECALEAQRAVTAAS